MSNINTDTVLKDYADTFLPSLTTVPECTLVTDCVFRDCVYTKECSELRDLFPSFLCSAFTFLGYYYYLRESCVYMCIVVCISTQLSRKGKEWS